MGGPDDEPATRADMRRVYESLGKLRDDMQDMRQQFVTPVDLELVRIDVRELEDWQTWAMRLVLGAVILALVGLVLTAQVPAR